MKIHFNLKFIGIILLMLTSAQVMFAATFTWDGGGGDNNWSTSTNWVGDVAPTGDGTEDIVFSGSTRSTNTNDIVGGSFKTITFSNDFTISGNSFVLNYPNASLKINASVTASISNNITYTNNVGGFSYSSIFTENNSVLTLSGTQTINNDLVMFSTVTSGTINISGSISGSYALSTPIGSGSGLIVNLTGNNSFTGGYSLNKGTLKIGHASALGTTAGTLSIASNTTIDNSSGGSLTLSNYPISIGGNFTFTGTNDLNLGTGNKTLTASPTITCSANSLTIGGIISGSFGLSKSGSGILILTGTNTFTGGVNLNVGTLYINNSSALGTTAGTFTIASGTTIGNSSGSVITTSTNPVTIAGSFAYIGTSSLVLSGATTLSANSTITISTATLTFSGVVSGGFNLIHDGTTHLILSGLNNTFTGTISSVSNAGAIFFNSIQNVSGGASSLGAPTSVANGTITLGSGSNNSKLLFQGSSSFATDRVIDLAGTTGSVEIISSGSGGAILTINADMTATGSGAKTLRLRGSGTTIMNGIIPNSGGGATSVSKITESGTWILAGNNTYTGTTTNSIGTLQIGNAGTTGSISSSSLVNNATLIFSRSNASTFAGNITGSGTLEKKSSGTLTLSGANTYSGSTTITNGTLEIGATNAITSSTIILNGGTISSGASTGYSNTTSGTLSLTENSIINLGSGSHTLAFAASNGQSWTANKTISITGWTGNFDGSSGTAGKIITGSSAELSSGKLDQIRFFRSSNSTYYQATQLSDGEIVPTAVALPVVFANISATKNAEVYIIKWSTLQEYNNHHFEIEKSIDGINFENIGNVEGIGNSNTKQEYNFIWQSKNINNKLYFRIKQVDFDSKFEYSTIVFCNENISNSSVIFPNPITNNQRLNILLNKNEDTKGELEITSIDGKLIFEENEINFIQNVPYTVEYEKFTKGEYVLKIKYDNGVYITKFLVN